MKSISHNRKIYLFIIPALILYLVFWIIPLFKLFQYSLTDSNGLTVDYNYVGFTNYADIFNNGLLWASTKNTIIYTLFVVLLGNALALGIAVLLNKKIRGMGFYRSVAYIPTLFSAIVVGFIWGYVYTPNGGMIANLMDLVGLDGSKFNFLGSFDTSLFAIALVDIWKNLGSGIVIFLAGLQTVPHELLEAAQIDGCSAWKQFRKVTFPMLASATTINLTLSVINSLKAFDYSYIMTHGGPGRSTYTLMYTVYRLAFTEKQYGAACALGVVSFAVMIMITIFFVRLMNKREVEV
jgi:ABC-type sugar transport system permease subunit